MKALPARDAERVNVFADMVADFFFQHGVTGGSPQLAVQALKRLKIKTLFSSATRNGAYLSFAPSPFVDPLFDPFQHDGSSGEQPLLMLWNPSWSRPVVMH